MTGVLEQLLAEVVELRREVAALRPVVVAEGHADGSTTIRTLGPDLPPEAIERIAQLVAERAADEVREQVEAILATAEPDDGPAPRVSSVSPPLLVVAPKATPATQTSPAKRAPRQDLASLVARAIDMLERDPTKAWKASELRPAIQAKKAARS